MLDHVVYDSFGNITTETSASSGDRFKFAGMEYDSSTGEYYDNARWYGTAGGRFESLDPDGFNAGDVNLYGYVGNGPTDGVDPSGMSSSLLGLNAGNINSPFVGVGGGSGLSMPEGTGSPVSSQQGQQSILINQFQQWGTSLRIAVRDYVGNSANFRAHRPEIEQELDAEVLLNPARFQMQVQAGGKVTMKFKDGWSYAYYVEYQKNLADTHRALQRQLRFLSEWRTIYKTYGINVDMPVTRIPRPPDFVPQLPLPPEVDIPDPRRRPR